MINLSVTVLNWYQQRSAPRLFSQAFEKQRKISIHEIINLNASKDGKRNYDYHNVTNTLSLFKMVRSRAGLSQAYLEDVATRTHCNPHHNTAARIVRRLNRSKLRGSVK